MRTLRMIRNVLASLLLLAVYGNSSAQSGLEDIIVEKYYVSDADDATDTDGGNLPIGSVTYRVYVDMTPGYELQAVYGNENHDLFITTSTSFFNNEDRGVTVGDQLDDIRLGDNTVALDSYVTIGAASDAHLGVLKEEDMDGSIVGGANSDGGSASIAGGLLTNLDPSTCIALTDADGLDSGTQPNVSLSPGLDLSVFNDVNAGPTLLVQGDAWFVAEGVQGPTAENRVLVAQITTNGQLTFELNIQIGTPSGDVEQYVATNAQAGEFQFAGLTFSSSEFVSDCGGCQAPTNLDVLEIGFGGPSPRVNAIWTNTEGTTDCEVRGGRISTSSFNAGEPEFANINNTQTITQTNGSTVLFNIVLFNNPNVPFIVGQRYGYEVRCACSDGSGFSEWANITPEATFVVPAPPPGVTTLTEEQVAKLNGLSEVELTVFPNPSEGDRVNFSIGDWSTVDIELIATVLDITGKVVYSSVVSPQSKNNSVYTIDFNRELTSGMYILMLQNDKLSLSSRFNVN